MNFLPCNKHIPDLVLPSSTWRGWRFYLIMKLIARLKLSLKTFWSQHNFMRRTRRDKNAHGTKTETSLNKQYQYPNQEVLVYDVTMLSLNGPTKHQIFMSGPEFCISKQQRGTKSGETTSASLTMCVQR